MTRKTEIEVEIRENGDVQIRVLGIKGDGCLEYEDLLRAVLGPVTERELTGEYHERDAHQATEAHGRVHTKVKR